IGFAIEDFHPDDLLFEAAAVAGERFVHGESQEAAQTSGARKQPAGQKLFELGADFLGSGRGRRRGQGLRYSNRRLRGLFFHNAPVSPPKKLNGVCITVKTNVFGKRSVFTQETTGWAAAPFLRFIPGKL